MSGVGRKEGKESRYGWVIVLASFLVSFALRGTFFTFGVFLKPIAEDFGWSRAEISGAVALSMVTQAVLGIPVGMLCDKYGPKLILGVTMVIATLGYLLMFWLSSLWQLYLFYGILVALGGAGGVVPIAAVSHWFKKQRGLAMGIILSGTGAGQIILAPWATSLILNYGWRLAYIAMAGVVFLFAFWPALLFRRPPEETAVLSSSPSPQERSLIEAARSRPFWLVFFIWFFSAIPTYLLMIHIIPHATDKGIAPQAAALIMTIMGVVGIIARVGVGFVSDRIGNVASYFISMFLQTVALFWLAWANQLWAFYIIGAFFITGFGGRDVILFKAMRDFFGLKAIAGILAALNLGWYAGAALGTPFGGYVFDTTGDYTWSFFTGGLSLVVAAILSVFLFRGQKGEASPLLRSAKLYE